MKRSARIETAVGLFAVVGMVLLVAIFFMLLRKEHAFEGRFGLVATFDNVSGLKPGAAVQLAGINVGSVGSVRFSEEDKAEVLLQIRDSFKYRIYRDAVASIATMGLLGDKIVILTSGRRRAGAVEDGAVIATEAYLEIGDIMNQIRPALENIQATVENMSRFFASLSAPVEELEKVLTSASQIAEQINAGEGTAGLLVKDPQLYSKLVALIEDANKTIRQLQEVAEDIRVASKDLPELSNSARKALANAEQGTNNFSDLVMSGKNIVEKVKAASEDFPDLVARIDRITENLETITENVKVGSGELPDLLATGREGLEQGLEMVEAARKSWLVRGYLERERAHEPTLPALRDTNYSREE